MATINVINIRTRPLDLWKSFVKTPEDWPKSSTCLCWWCCHSFDTVPCMLPVRFTEKTREIQATGNFCSWNCVKRYAFTMQQLHNTPPPGVSYIGILAMLTSMRCDDKEMHSLGLCDCQSVDSSLQIPMAGDRESLQAFGGNRTIEEFRRGFLLISSPERIRYLFESSIKDRRPLRNCTFSRVSYDGPTQIFKSTVQVLPYSSRTVVAPNLPPSNSKLLPNPNPQQSSRRTRTNRNVPLATTVNRTQMLAVNEEQAFYAKRLNAGGNMLTSMGVTIRPSS